MQTDQSKPERETIICICSLDGQVRAEQRRLDAQRRLGVTDPSRLVEMLIMSLAFDFRADLEVYSDQWFAIDVEAGDYQDDIQADHPLDGMIALWFRLLEAFPGKLDRPAQESPHTVEWSARQVARLRESSAAVAAHDLVCESCQRRPDDRPERVPRRCPAGIVVWLESVHDRKSLIGKWGVSTMRESPRFWGER